MSVPDKSELKSLVESARTGDDKSFEKLLKLYSPLITSLVTKYAGDGLTDAEDLRQEALIAFFNAVMKFNPASEEVEFGLFAKLCVERALISQLRTMSRSVRPELVEEIEDIDSQAGEDPSARIIESEGVRDMWKIINEMLSDFESKVWNLHLSGASTAAIAEKLSKDEKSISNALCRIRSKLRRALAGRV